MATPSLGRTQVLTRVAPRRQLHALSISLIALLCFLLLALVVHGAQPTSFDVRIRDAVHAESSSLLTQVMLYTTQLGAIVALTFLSAGVILGFLFLRLGRAAGLMAANMVGAWIWNDSLKEFFHRARPEPFFGLPPPGDFSFPSGHSLCSFCFYGMMTALFVARARNQVARIVIISIAILIIAGVGISRVYLGVHYPTDVLGGWLIGLCWVSFLLVFDKREEPRIPDPSIVEPAATEVQS